MQEPLIRPDQCSLPFRQCILYDLLRVQRIFVCKLRACFGSGYSELHSSAAAINVPAPLWVGSNNLHLKSCSAAPSRKDVRLKVGPIAHRAKRGFKTNVYRPGFVWLQLLIVAAQNA